MLWIIMKRTFLLQGILNKLLTKCKTLCKYKTCLRYKTTLRYLKSIAVHTDHKRVKSINESVIQTSKRLIVFIFSWTKMFITWNYKDWKMFSNCSFTKMQRKQWVIILYTCVFDFSQVIHKLHKIRPKTLIISWSIAFFFPFINFFFARFKSLKVPFKLWIIQAS